MSRISELLDRASAATRLDDFGSDSYREGLEILVFSADAQARLNERGRAMFDGQIVDLLSRRLEVEHWYALHPEIDEPEIVAPLIGLGLPRTGSTAFSCLLAEDPAVRFIRTWEGDMPCPPPESATEHSDPRIAASAQRIELTNQYFPRLKAMLPLSATGPIECQNFMAYDFKSQTFLATARLPDYTRWLLHEADLVPTYRYLKRVLKLLQWRCPPSRWRLKNPSHTAFIGALDAVFPDARYWMTHRDIASVIPSVVDLYREMSGPNTDALDTDHIVRTNIDWWELGMQRLIAFREAGQGHRFFDVHFATFQQDPIAVIADLYAFLGEPLTDETRRRMAIWRQENPADKHGRNRYDAAALGIDIAELRQTFRFYSEYFGVAEANPASSGA